MKFYSKTKSTQKLGYRTPDHHKGKTFGRPATKAPHQAKFSPGRFKAQHKG